MIVNTASKCGYTPQYEGLEAIYEKYKDKGLSFSASLPTILWARNRAPKKRSRNFARSNITSHFRCSAKISVKGTDQHPLYTYLTNAESDPQFAGDITWNFEKFIADKHGNIIARFPPKTTPDSPEVVKAIETAVCGELAFGGERKNGEFEINRACWLELAFV